MVRNFAILLTLAALLSSCGFKRHKYDNPISKDTKQPDKVLYDKAVNDIEHGRFEVARITLNTSSILTIRASSSPRPSSRSLIAGFAKAACTVLLRPKPSTRISSSSTRPWKRPPNRK